MFRGPGVLLPLRVTLVVTSPVMFTVVVPSTVKGTAVYSPSDVVIWKLWGKFSLMVRVPPPGMFPEINRFPLASSVIVTDGTQRSSRTSREGRRRREVFMVVGSRFWGEQGSVTGHEVSCAPRLIAFNVNPAYPPGPI